MNEMAVALLERSAKRFGIPKDDILGDDRFPEVVAARHAWWKAMRLKGWSYSRIARTACCHHTTIMYALKKGGPDAVRAA